MTKLLGLFRCNDAHANIIFDFHKKRRIMALKRIFIYFEEITKLVQCSYQYNRIQIWADDERRQHPLHASWILDWVIIRIMKIYV